MKKLNWYFYQVWLPLHLLTIVLLFTVSINWWLVAVFWLIFGPLATGVGLHRLFAHRSFKTNKYVEYLLGYLSTLSAYAPILFWVAQHQYHHKFSDTDQDPTSPKHRGLLYSFLYWRFLKSNLDKADFMNYCSRQMMKNKVLMFLNTHFTKIVYLHVIVLFLISPALLLSVYLLPTIIESIRINLLNSVSHVKGVPFNYRNHEINDESYNNLILGYLSLGFGWHNNHHADPKKCVIHDKWWELDIEGYIAHMLSKIK